MLRILNLSFFLGLILSIVASSGVGLFRSLTQELIGFVTFSLLVHIIFFTSGALGLLSYFNFGDRVVSLVHALSKKLLEVFFPMASLLLGITLGAIIYAISTHEWKIVLKGAVVMFFVWVQVWASTGHLRQSLYFIERKVRSDKTEALATLVVSGFLLVIGALGIWDMLSKTST